MMSDSLRLVIARRALANTTLQRTANPSCPSTPSISSPRYHASSEKVFHRGSTGFHGQRYSRTKVRDPVVRAGLNLRPLMIVLIPFVLESFVDVQVKGWLKLTSEQREQCIMKLRYSLPRFISAWLCRADSTRDLVRQRDQMAHSFAVDANELEKRLK